MQYGGADDTTANAEHDYDDQSSFMRILIADDDVTARMVLASVLMQSGHEVEEVADGTDALAALLRPEAPRLAILDWMMPGVEGIELCRRLRAHAPDRPPYLVLVTSRGAKADLAEGLRAGADDYLTKPFDPQELNARIEVGCRMIGLQDRLADTIEELRQALGQVKTLRGIVPICAACKKIRDDQGFWRQVEAYISSHSEAKFSHGLCPTCTPKYFPGLQGSGSVETVADCSR
jgi:phosphoserine phosphatase RsbU/P